MTYRNFLTVTAVLGFVFGLGFLLIPGTVLGLYNATLEAGSASEVIARLYGCELVGLGLLAWLARAVSESALRRPINVANFVANGLGFLVSLWAQISGTSGVNALGWSTVVIYLLLAAGFAYFEFMPQGRQAARAA